mmetsp:Transcript_596/g.927  ORF Transcript_596/g.927 Transcript_596/m.927 type:complete len:211 (+) Transcript_596:665-1297(+)
MPLMTRSAAIYAIPFSLVQEPSDETTRPKRLISIGILSQCGGETPSQTNRMIALHIINTVRGWSTSGTVIVTRRNVRAASMTLFTLHNLLKRATKVIVKPNEKNHGVIEHDASSALWLTATPSSIDNGMIALAIIIVPAQIIARKGGCAILITDLFLIFMVYIKNPADATKVNTERVKQNDLTPVEIKFMSSSTSGICGGRLNVPSEKIN